MRKKTVQVTEPEVQERTWWNMSEYQSRTQEKKTLTSML